ncbi:hypothetical protein CAPTEDRAFT_225770 [Capitella teleta]|uniref:Gfo/Idh/MocA-like oxidoreductase N-terminal domain-containing protein n=1 Tax=Capitella teleta TaxID=283909 RepID=R7T7C7_CAPTE|nr:hypothetical protein CAPTEDRAFT_225770 [Capitella teleta]|eukprot:ELT89308.1 hypothetical protein CAPTEDRAFT_225770 [Capitella teleta]
MSATSGSVGASQNPEMATAASGTCSLFRVALVGLGIAGRARLRDIPKMAPLIKGCERVQLAGFVSRRTLGEIDGVPQMDLDDVMKEGNDIKAVIISTENARHEELARRALQVKKHVLVDYPIVLNASAAKQLQGLAQQHGVLCYEEDIALITDQFQALKNLVKTRGALKEASVSMQGGFNGWIEDFSASGSPFHSGINLLQTHVDMFGDLTASSCEIRRTENEITAKAVLHNTDKRLVTIDITRGPQMTRAKKFRYEFTDGSVIDETTELEDLSDANKDKPKPLFMRDFQQFMLSVNGDRDNKYNEWLTICCLQLADDLYAMAQDNPRSLL